MSHHNGTVIHLRLPADLAARLDALAKAQDRSMAWVARMAMVMGIEKAEEASGVEREEGK